jgi:hypothetical protein
MSLLLEQKANVLAVDQNQNTPLHLAVYTDPASVAVVRLLLGYSANVNAKNANGDTPLHLLAGARYHTKDDILQLLLDRGGDMTIPNVRHSLTHSLTRSLAQSNRLLVPLTYCRTNPKRHNSCAINKLLLPPLPPPVAVRTPILLEIQPCHCKLLILSNWQQQQRQRQQHQLPRPRPRLHLHRRHRHRHQRRFLP